jgi:hypothetical protein
MSFGEGDSRNPGMSRLTQRTAGRSDNSEEGKTPWLEAIMA